MNKISFIALLALLVFSGCSKGLDPGDVNVNPGTDQSGVSETDVKNNLLKVFGVTFDPNHDWCTTVAGDVTINLNSSVKKVQILACVPNGVNEDNEQVTAMRMLNEVETSNQNSVKMYYDAPKNNLGLYAAFISDGAFVLQKIEGKTVSLPTKARTRTLSYNYDLPTGELKIGAIEDSYASQRGWVTGEKLYMMDNYSSQKMNVPDYDAEFKQKFNDFVFSYLPQTKYDSNLDVIKKTGYYDANVYPLTTGEEPIIVSPVYKRDGAPNYGPEVYNSDLYYYYFKEGDLGSDPVAYIQSLPKYKAMPLSECYARAEDNILGKRGAFALVYWGDGVPQVGTEGSYSFPKGYKIGFMLRSKTDIESKKKQGELYADGRLNEKVNSYGNFTKLKGANPRAGWLTLDGRMLICWESGTDRDFNDLVIDIEGGVEDMIVIPEPEKQAYTFCFEDTRMGDYDLNDVVIKAVRENETKVTYTLLACGAYNELFVRNINTGKITDNAEVHSLFGKQPMEFINTESGAEKLAPIVVTKTVDKSFSMLDDATMPYIFDKTTNYNVYISRVGQDPHGIMIPNDFKYPLEKVCIKDAYAEFNNWGVNQVTSTDWYTKPTSGKVYEK